MYQLLTTLFIILIIVSTVFGQVIKENETIIRIETYLAELEKVGFNGSVLVELNGENRISKGFGFSNKEKQIKNSTNTIFDIGSITKQFTATAILKLEMQNKLSTDDKLPKFFNNVPEDKKNITIHDLLRHQSGLISNIGRDYEKISKDEFINKVLSSSLKYEVGSSFNYSNIAYSLLALIIEKVSGQNYESYLYENLWKPSQMEMTGYSRPQYDSNLIAIGYDRDGNVWGKPTDKEWDSFAPYWHLSGNGGILSTTEDLYKWYKILKTNLILSKEAKQKLYHPKLRDDESENFYYAYGWDVSNTSRNTKQIWHNGSNNIFYADFINYDDEDIVLIMLSNNYHPSFIRLNQVLSNIIFNTKYIPVIPTEDNETNRDFTNRIINVIEEFGLENAKQDYLQRNSNENILEYILHYTGFDFLDEGKYEIATNIFEMNLFVYPNSSKALQDLGECYMETGKIEFAIKYFKASLMINPEGQFAKDMLKKLEE